MSRIVLILAPALWIIAGCQSFYDDSVGKKDFILDESTSAEWSAAFSLSANANSALRAAEGDLTRVGEVDASAKKEIADASARIDTWRRYIAEARRLPYSGSGSGSGASRGLGPLGPLGPILGGSPSIPLGKEMNEINIGLGIISAEQEKIQRAQARIKENSAQLEIASKNVEQARRISAAVPPPPFRTQDVLFGTNRVRTESASSSTSFGAQRGELVFGKLTISVPNNRRIGTIDRPDWTKLQFREDPRSHMVILKGEILNVEDFKAKLRNENGNSPRLLFIHGYNVSFDDAARRTAQMSVDLGLEKNPLFFSWPSHGVIRMYPNDAANAEWTERHLREFLTIVANGADDAEMVVIAHSMGSRPFTRVLARLMNENTGLRTKFREVVLAAPDIDADIFREEIAPALITQKTRLTLYSSSKDKALSASRQFNGQARAGDAGEGLIVLSGLDTIDATNVDTDFLGHSYFAQTRTLLTDLSLIFKVSVPADQRPTLDKRYTKELPYFVFKQ